MKGNPLDTMDLASTYRNKRIFLTGHTGFKGCWLAWWLKEMGAQVYGYSLPAHNIRGNLFEQTDLAASITSFLGNLNETELLKDAIEKAQPEFVFHLAAQALVLESYQTPLSTYESNVMGTVRLLEILRSCESVKSVVVVTTDKCYENKEWCWAYRELDPLGGKDPYSSSKAMVELATQAYYQSFFKEKGVGVATARAGNVIGGGDFATDRIIPDIVEAISLNQPVVLRSPDAVRPWQHVLDALYGYLLLGKALTVNPNGYSTPFNFSPPDNSNNHTVLYIVQQMIRVLGQGSYLVDKSARTRKGHEASYLRLDASKAQSLLNWRPVFNTEEAIAFTADWYRKYLDQPQSKFIQSLVKDQLQAYTKKLI